MQALGRRMARAGRAWAVQGRAGLERWARAGRHGRRAWALGVARRQACVSARAGVGRRQQLASAVGAWAWAAGGAQVRWAWARRALSVGAQGVGRGRAGRAASAGQDRALGAPDLIFKPVFDSVFFLSQ